MLEGKNVNLRIMEKEDIPLFAEWINKPDVLGEYDNLRQKSRAEIEKEFDTSEEAKFVVEKKDGSKIGIVVHFALAHPAGKLLEIGYFFIPEERGKGYGTEAVKMIVDYLFLSKDMMRVQACTDVRNVASQKTLEKAGFKKEGILRKGFYCRGEWADDYMYSILREEWKARRILAKATS